MIHSFIFGIITFVNIFYYTYFNYKVVHEKGISLFYHLYFCVLATFVYKNSDLIECSVIYFISDSLLNIYFNTFRTFNKYHHLFILTLLYFNEYLNKDIINYAGMHEFSTILLCLIDMKLIKKNVFDILFPISFIMCRLVIFNWYVLYYIYYNMEQMNTFTYIILILLNTMNFGIVIKMKLTNKICNLCKMI